MGGTRYGQMLIEGFVRAIPWAIVFSLAGVLTVSMILGMIKQDVKEAMEYAGTTAVKVSMAALLEDQRFNRDVLPKLKQATKEAIEYTFDVANRKLVANVDRKSAVKK